MGPTESADPHRDSVETSISSVVSGAISFSTFHTSDTSFLKQWATFGSQHPKLTCQSDVPCGQLQPFRCALWSASAHQMCSVVGFSQSDVLCGQLQPLCLFHKATSHSTCNVLWPRKGNNFGKSCRTH